METVFIDRRGTDLSINHGRLKIKNESQKIDTSLPLQQMRALVITCDCSLSASMLRGLDKYGVSLVCLHPNDVEASFVSIPNSHGNVHRKINQYELARNKQMSQRIALLLVRIKIRQQKIAIERLIQTRPQNRTELTRALSQFPAFSNELLSSNINQLMGFEGASARAYFSGFTSVFPASVGFVKRIKRPPKDPVNSTLSLTYTLLYFEALRACHAVGLEPLIGFLHQSTYGRASLACDLMELCRTKADKWVLSLFKSQTLKESHFLRKEGTACLLSKSGRKIYFENLMLHLPLWRSQLRLNSERLARYIDKLEASD